MIFGLWSERSFQYILGLSEGSDVFSFFYVGIISIQNMSSVQTE